jgi:hypothetical protein
MQGCKARTQREVLKSFSLKSHQSNKCYGGAREEKNGGGQPMTPRSRSNGFPSLREGINGIDGYIWFTDLLMFK